MKSGACDSLVPQAAGRRPATGDGAPARAAGAAVRRRSTAPASTAAGTQREQGSRPGRPVRRRRRRRQPGRRWCRCRTCRAWSEIEQLNYEKEVARPLLERAPDRSLRRRPARLRREDDRRSACRSETWRPDAELDDADGRRRPAAAGPRRHGSRPAAATAGSAADESLHRRHRLRPAAAEDAQGRPHVRVHAGRCATAASRSWCSRRRSSSAATSPRTASMVLVKGKFERDDESARILASEIAPIEMVRERLATSVAIRLSTPPHDRATFERLWDVFAQHKGDRRVAFDIEVQRRRPPAAREGRRQRADPRPAVGAAGRRKSRRSAAPAR